MFIRTATGQYINTDEIVELRPNHPYAPEAYFAVMKSGREHELPRHYAEAFLYTPVAMTKAEPGAFVVTVYAPDSSIDIGMEPVLAWGVIADGETIPITYRGVNNGVHDYVDVLFPDGEVRSQDGERWPNLQLYVAERKAHLAALQAAKEATART